MKLLLSNDDGINAPGLLALVSAAKGFGDLFVVAPAGPQSGVSHAVTYEGSVRIEARGDGRYAVHGTPADCSRLGLHKIVPNADWVLSGVNHGGNLGADVYYSGTVAAVREAVLHGWPGIAFSQYCKRGMEVDWRRAARWVERVLTALLARPVERGLFYNVNFPHLSPSDTEPEIIHCPLDPLPLPLSYRHEAEELFYDGDYHNRMRTEGADVDTCFGGRIAVTSIRLF
ncbi:MAG TPA: 5'/3'-nucleotidase SurE [Chthoniobacteraceae bacterium]|nr:5'/3'-nucleotidase SurE [Chthoniobacteraceae bacterium]